MAQSLAKILLHVVFSVKDRRPLISDEDMAALHAYIAATCRDVAGSAFRVGGTADHVHIACCLPRDLTVADLVRRIKVSSSSWLKSRPGVAEDFAWQTGYGVFSLGESQLPVLSKYIDEQAGHHRTMSFQEELVDFLKRYRIEYDERYLWD